MSRNISPKELIKMHVNPIKVLDLPSQKSLIPTNTDEEKESTAERLQSLKRFLQQTRVDRKNTRSEAAWLPERRLSRLTRRAGKAYHSFGFTENCEIYLNPEESLYLLETNQLELLWNGVSLSLEQAYSVLLQNKASLEKYRAFRELAGLGYRIQEPEITKKRRNQQETSSKKRSKTSEEAEDPEAEIFERLKEEGPKSVSICGNYSTLFNVYLPKNSIKTSNPDFEIIKKPEGDVFSCSGASENGSSTVTAFTENDSVSFYQFHEVDIENK